MGLRSTQAGTRARFSDKRREYLTITANGERLFSTSEFLTSKQISGVFSRLASKKKLAGQNHDDHDLDDERSQENEAAFAGLKDKVMDEVIIRHPIYYDHNICKLAATDKLSKLSVGMLNDICQYFGIATQDFGRGRKAPYITKPGVPNDTFFRIEALLAKTRF